MKQPEIRPPEETVRRLALPDDVQKRLNRLEVIEDVLAQELGVSLRNCPNALQLRANLQCELRDLKSGRPTRGD